MQQLNQDMELHGQGYAVPPDLMPVFDTILQCVFSVTPEAIAKFLREVGLKGRYKAVTVLAKLEAALDLPFHDMDGQTALIIAAAECHGQSLDGTELAEIIDTLFYPNESKGQGTSICALGLIDGLLTQPSPPNSFLNSAFFANEKQLIETLLPLTNQTELARCEETLNAIRTDGLDPEIALSVSLNRAGLERCLNKTPSESKVQLAKDFATQWLRQSREGGLKDSLARMHS